MRHSESYFGLENIGGRISADGGESFLPKYVEMSMEDFNDLVFDIENHIEKELSDDEISELKDILE